MATDTYSWLKKVIGPDTYDYFKSLANLYIPIASLALIAVIVLTQFFYWVFLSYILNLITGTSLIFGAYLFGVVLFLDKGINIEIERDPRDYEHYRHPVRPPKGYTATKIWGISLVILAIVAIYITNKYRKHYAFKCETFLVDEDNGIYHLKGSYDKKSKHYTSKMKGYQIEEHGYILCETCDDWASDTEDIYASERFSRR